MKLPRRLTVLLFFLVAVIAVQLAHHLQHWYRHRDARAELLLLREELIDAGAEMVRLQLEAERLREEIEAEDRRLEERRRGVEAYGRFAHGGTLPHHLYGAYREELAEFNARIHARNERFHGYNDAVVRRNSAAARYGVLADSMRSVAERAGEPYYPVPLPAEAANERGVGYTP